MTLTETVTQISTDTASYYDNLNEIIELLQNDNQEGDQEILDAIQLSAQKIEMMINRQAIDLQLSLGQVYLTMIQQMNNLRTQITRTELHISDILSLMSMENDDNHQEIKTSFTTLSTFLQQINIEFTATYDEIKGF